MAISQINNVRTSFGAKLLLKTRNENIPFNNKTKKQIEDTFAKETSDNSGELLVVYDRNIANNDVYSCYYNNKEHSDKFVITVNPEFSKMPVFVDRLKNILNTFVQREESINRIKKTIADFETNTIMAIKDGPSVLRVSQYNRWD